MIKILLTVAVLGSVDSFASLAMAQDKQGEAVGSGVSAQCAHRRVMGPDPHNDCIRKLRGDAQLGYGRGPLGYRRGPFGYGQGQVGYVQDQRGYRQDQLSYGQGGASATSPDERDEEQPKVRQEQPKTSQPKTSQPKTSQPKTSAAPKVATAPAPKAKKASTPPRVAAQKEQQLYQEFLEWRNRRLFFE